MGPPSFGITEALTTLLKCALTRSWSDASKRVVKDCPLPPPGVLWRVLWRSRGTARLRYGPTSQGECCELSQFPWSKERNPSSQPR